MLESQQTHHTPPLRASYVVSIFEDLGENWPRYNGTALYCHAIKDYSFCETKIQLMLCMKQYVINGQCVSVEWPASHCCIIYDRCNVLPVINRQNFRPTTYFHQFTPVETLRRLHQQHTTGIGGKHCRHVSSPSTSYRGFKSRAETSEFPPGRRNIRRRRDTSAWR